MKKSLLLAASLITLSLTSAYAASSGLTFNESYSVKIPHYSVMLDSAKHTIDITAFWTFKTNPTSSDYVDSNLVISEIKKYLTDYPNKSDFWETVNRNLTSHLINRFGMLHSISIKLDVPATKIDPYDHYTLVEASR